MQLRRTSRPLPDAPDAPARDAAADRNRPSGGDKNF
jgi:hypothetical protein